MESVSTLLYDKLNSQTIFETERLIIHPYTMADLDNFFRLNGNEDVMRYIRRAQTFQESEVFLKKIIADYKMHPEAGRWAMYSKEGRSYLGSFAIIPVENSDKLQLGYALLKENWGKGYASESVRGGVYYAFHRLGLSEIAGITYPENIASQKVLLKNGFVFDKTIIEEDRLMNLYILHNPAGRI